MKAKTKLISIVLALLMAVSLFMSVPAVSAKSTATVNGVSVNVGDNVKVNYYARSTELWEDFQGSLSYDTNGLQFESFNMPNITSGLHHYTNDGQGNIYFSGSSVDLYDFKNEAVLFTAEFTVSASGQYNIPVYWEIIDDGNSNTIADQGNIDETKLSFRMTVDATPVEGNYSVSYFLSEVTSSNKTELVKRGSSYKTTLTPTEGYEIKTLICTNGDDVLPYTVEGDSYVLSTDNVAGDIVITAVATKKQPSSTETSSTSTDTPPKPNVKVTKVTLNATSKLLNVGKSFNLKAKVYPSNAYNKGISWSATNKRVAVVTQSGRVTAKSKGYSYIRATAKDGSKKCAQCKITVKQPVTKVKLSVVKKVLKVKKKFKIKATVKPENANVKKVKWTVNKKNIIKISKKQTSSGKYIKVTAKKKGSVILIATATDGSKRKASCKITVKK